MGEAAPKVTMAKTFLELIEDWNPKKQGDLQKEQSRIKTSVV